MMTAKPAEHDPERPVIEAIREGDPQAMTELIRRQGPWVRGVLFSVLGALGEVDDVAQRVWLQVWREARRLDDPSRWRVWLYRITRNAATDALRARRRRSRVGSLPTAGDGPALTTPPADRPLIDNDRFRTMLKAIAALPPLYREPFVLRHLEDWSYRQIAEVLGLPSDTVETRLVRARRLLRERLAGRV